MQYIIYNYTASSIAHTSHNAHNPYNIFPSPTALSSNKPYTWSQPAFHRVWFHKIDRDSLLCLKLFFLLLFIHISDI